MKKVKLIFSVLAMMTLLTFSTEVSGQEVAKSMKYEGHSTKFALMISNENHFIGAVETGITMNVKKNKFAFEIVVVGKLAEDLALNKELISVIDKAHKNGIKIVICEQALAFFNIEKTSLDKRLYTTPNAWIYMFELKDKGFNSLTI